MDTQTKSLDNVFIIDTDPKVLKMKLKLKPLLVKDNCIAISNISEDFGFKKLLSDPAVWLKVMSLYLTYGASSALEIKDPKYESEISSLIHSFEEIPFTNIKEVLLRKLFMSDHVIDMVYSRPEGDRKVSFYVIKGYYPNSEATKNLYNLLLSKSNKR